MTLPAAVLDLIRRFDNNAPQYRSPADNETEARRELIDPPSRKLKTSFREGKKIHFLHLLLSFCFLLLALASKRFSGPFHQVANNYLGDLFIVGWLYFLVLLVLPRLKPAMTAALVFTMAAFVEIAQAYGLSLVPGLPGWALFWTGAQFDPLDMAVYAAGAALAALTDLLLRRAQLTI